MELLIGPRLYSTWSLRGWLVLSRTGAEFTLRQMDYETEAGRAELAQASPSGFVPVVKVDGEAIWDTLAIAEWAAERWPESRLWPTDATARALARSVCAEMHSGFSALRTACGMSREHPQVGSSTAPTPVDDGLERDLARILDLWRTLRARFGDEGPWLLGAWSIADAFFTPVAARMRHFRIDLAARGDADGAAQAYRDALLAQADFLAWEAEALRNG